MLQKRLIILATYLNNVKFQVNMMNFKFFFMFSAIILMLCLVHLQIFNKSQIIHSLESNFSNLESFNIVFLFISDMIVHVGACNQKIERKSCFNRLSHIVLTNSPNADLQGIVYTSRRITHYENCVHTM